MLTAKPVDVRHKAILITINRLYRSDMTNEELYEATRGVWKVGQKRDRAEYAIAVYQGIAREVYRIRTWHPAGTLPYRFREPEDVKITSQVRSDLPPVFVERQGTVDVFQELLVNGLKAVRRGDGSKQISVSSRRSEGPYVELLFSNSGPPIPEEA